MTQAAPDVYRAIRDVSQAMSKFGIQKNGTNEQQKFHFRGIDDVLDALSGPLVAAGLVIVPNVLERAQTERPTKSGGVQYSVVVKVRFDLVSANDGSHHFATMVGEAMDSGDKATSKAISMAYKYMAFDTFCIPVSGLDDADKTTPPATVSKSAKAAPAAEPEEVVSATADKASESPSDDVEVWLEKLRSATSVEETSTFKIAISKLRNHARWEELKTAWAATNARLANQKKESA